jgi:ethanolamine ammonia-lyase small subunit
MDDKELRKFIKGVVKEVMSETSTKSGAKSYTFNVYNKGKKVDKTTAKDVVKAVKSKKAKVKKDKRGGYYSVVTGKRLGSTEPSNSCYYFGWGC